MKVLFVGISNKINLPPLDSSTKSGALVDRVINSIDAECIKSNLVNIAPVDERGKLRYPSVDEIKTGYSELERLIKSNKPLIVVGLGTIVCDFLNNKVDNLIKIKHPSYVLTYKKHLTEEYITSAVAEINKIVNKID